MPLPAAMQYPLSAADDSNSEVEDDEEEEDIDFNPFLREETSSEASSSLSSENEGPSDNTEKSLRSSQKFRNTSTSSRPTDETQGCQYAVNEELIMTQAMDEEFRETDDISQNCTRLDPISSTPWERSQVSIAGVRDVSSSGDGDYASSEFMKEILLEQTKSCSTLNQKTSVQIDEEDAICRRTRAQHSLANYTLEELETFLQESDDDDDRQNVNDEEEYHKFLAAVLVEGVDRGQAVEENVNLDDDEENDADFVLELEEALESHIDESPRKIETRGSNQERGAYRPQTRQNRGLKESSKGKNYLLEQAKVPIRPILPNVSNAQSTPVRTFPWKLSPPKIFSNCTSSPRFATELINGFTAYQIGQLYCLVYEHVQLLVQVFSVCVLDPSRQEVAMEVQKMIVEMIDKRDDALSWRLVPYPASCFHQHNLSSPLNFGFRQATKCSTWTPLIDNPVLSVLDVPPLTSAKSYMSDVSATVLAHRQRHLECSGNQNSLQRQPLFSLPMLASASETNIETLGGTDAMIKNTVQPVPSGEQQPKKSLASTIVENTMKKSVALVPKDIAKLAQRFFPLFNSSLFPHKPPLASVANRVLFTDAEDGLLAMGLMDYNNDWMAIQKHFLPCKSQHQIFVRQKNRSSSKAPENPIKAVRRLKTSPLTADEMALINEGIRIFKHDWLMIGKSCVPHRDPSLLPRQWRVATGTQKSYSTSEISKCKRRLYEAKRRQLKASAINCQSLLGEKVSNREQMEGDNIDVESEAYIQEAFLADAEPRNCKRVPYDILLSSVHPCNVLSKTTCMDTEISKKHAVFTAGCSESQEINAAAHDIVTSSNSIGDINPVSHISHDNCSLPSTENLVSNLIMRPPTGNLCPLPRHMRKSRGKLVVKLAPGLPPVNLPQSVRVLSKSAFKSYDIRSSYSKTGDNATKTNLHSSSQVSREGTATSELVNHINMFRKNGPSIDKEETSSEDRFMTMNDASESDLNIHPLLFQASEDQFSSYYSVNSNASSTYNFFPEVPVQDESDLFRPQSSVGNPTDAHFEAPSLSLRTIDFHPLLQRAGNVTDEYAFTSTSVEQFSGDLEIVEGNCNSSVNYSILRAPLVDDHLVATETAYRGHLSKEKLDLEIHLCSANNNQKTTGNLEMGEHQCVEENICRLENRLSEKDLHSGRLFPNSKDKHNGISVWNDSTDKSKRSTSLEVLSSNGDTCLRTEDSYGEPACDIVMEQEELSDSEEEIQHLEFECEEMDDSEGEGSDNEAPCENQTKELLTVTAEQVERGAIYDLNQPHQLSYPLQESIGKDKTSENLVQVAFQDSCHPELSQLKYKGRGGKRDRSSGRSDKPGIRSRRRKKEQNTADPFAGQLGIPVAGNQESSACRRHRKRLLPLSC